MNKLELLKLKKSLLTSLLIATTTFETLTFGQKNVKASEVTDVIEIDVSDLEITSLDSNDEVNDFEIIDSVALDVETNTELEDTNNKYKESIEYYSNVYDLDSEKVYDVIAMDTAYFNSTAWKSSNSINSVSYDSKEEAIILTIRDISLNPTAYGFTNLSEIKSDTKYEPTMTPEELNAKYADIFGVNKEVSMSICYAECGPKMNSHKFRTANNPAGLGDMVFPNREVAFIYYINLLKTSYGCTKNSDVSFFSRVASKYCELPEHWISLTTPHYYNLVNDYYYYNHNTTEETPVEDISLTRKLK